MASITTYDPAKHLVSFNGLTIPPAFGPDTYLKVSRAGEGFTRQKGAGGEGGRSMNRDRGGTVELTLMANSVANDLLMAVAVADELTAVGAGPLFIKELNGTTKVGSMNAWIQKIPDIERAKELGTVTWVFECDDLEMFVGGHF